MFSNQHVPGVGLRRRTVISFPLGVIGVALTTSNAEAGSVNKGSMHYQDSPKGGARCADCAAYIVPTAEHPDAPGCKLVAGPISANGWCIAFSKA